MHKSLISYPTATVTDELPSTMRINGTESRAQKQLSGRPRTDADDDYPATRLLRTMQLRWCWT